MNLNPKLNTINRLSTPPISTLELKNYKKNHKNNIELVTKNLPTIRIGSLVPICG
ncbi:hypothetical protein I6Y99_004865 [Vibrio parahaemolyticus]|uniref:hypothetical protein n=1 Tax=Vibrio sp. K4 TaxID=3391579 RepID=UPI000B275BEB|nr:hypothetical protein [Vibrio parahaemolyticus]MDF4896721.1 hypothetical protein [Vibrio parahaemolyticus]MDG2642112.1 hypothetical protein [Vibrio parahaemolyticus]MDG2809712.1 hypothetical protein [Vibrio parahaemolyticus]HBC3612728.1 hypothetical protein [Vibrio parahaemolyticus]